MTEIRKEWELSQTVPEPQSVSFGDDRTPSDEILFSDIPKTVSIQLTQDQFNKLFDSISLGAEMLYGSSYSEVLGSFWLQMIEGGVMSCEDVADCFEEQLAIDSETNLPVNQNFYNSVTNIIASQGFSNPDRVNATQTRIADRQQPSFNSDEIKTLANCDLNALWAGIRYGIVDRLDESLHDALQDVAAIPTIIGRNAAWIDIIPVLGDIAEATVTTISSVVPTLLSLFESYSSTSSKDELACELFSIVCSQCRYPTHEEVYDHFKNYGMETTPSIAEWTLDVMTNLLTNPVGVAAKVAYFTLMTWQLGIIYLNARFNQARGTAALGRMAGLGEDYANDNWIELCEACDESWQIIEFDFTQSPSGWKLAPQIASGGFGGKWVAGSGWEWTNNSSGDWAVIIYDIEPQWRLRGAGFNYTGVINAANSGISFRPNPASNTGVVNLSLSTGTVYNRSNCLLTVNQGYRQVQMGINKGDANPAYIEKAFLIFDAGYGTGARAASRAIC